MAVRVQVRVHFLISASTWPNALLFTTSTLLLLLWVVANLYDLLILHPGGICRITLWIYDVSWRHQVQHTFHRFCSWEQTVFHSVMVAVGARGLRRKRDAAEGCCTTVPWVLFTRWWLGFWGCRGSRNAGRGASPTAGKREEISFQFSSNLLLD